MKKRCKQRKLPNKNKNHNNNKNSHKLKKAFLENFSQKKMMIMLLK